MGKPLIHMIPSQEATLRGSSTATSGSEGLRQKQTKSTIVWKGKQPPPAARLTTKANIVKRSSTNASNQSSKTSRSNSSNESGVCSFVHSNASLSSSDEPKTDANINASKNALVPDSITTSSVSSASKANQESKYTAKRTTNVEVALEPPSSGQSNNIEANDTRNDTKQEAGDETTISSISSYQSTSFGSIHHSTQRADHGVIPRFEVLLDEIPEQEIEPAEIATNSSVQKPSDSSAINPRLVITRRSAGSVKHRKHNRSIALASSGQFVSAIDQHVATRRRNRPRRIKKVVHSIEVVKSLKVEDDIVFVNEDTISVISDSSPSKKVSTTATSDLNRVLSPSIMKGARQSPSIITASFKAPPLSESDTNVTKKKKKIYSISSGQLVVDEIDVYEAIELRETGSVILEQPTQESCVNQEEEDAVVVSPPSYKTKEEIVKKPYSLVRLEESNAGAVVQRNRSKASSRSLISKGFRRKNRQSKNATSSSTLSQNSIKVVDEDNNTGGIELLRTPTNIGSSNAFSYDENDEDTILKKESPPPSPIPPVESLHIVGEDNDIEVVAPSVKHERKSSIESIPPVSDVSMDRIVSISKLSDENDLIKTTPPVESLSLKETPAPPKIIEPVVEVPSNRVEDPYDMTSNRVEDPVEMTRTNSSSTQSAASIPSKYSNKSSPDSPPRDVTADPRETDTAVDTEEKVPKNGDQLVVVVGEQSKPKIAKTVVIPRIPASKRDTSSKKKDISSRIASFKTDNKSLSSSKQSSRKVKIQVQAVQKPDGNVKNIEVSSVATPTSAESEGKVSALVKKYSTMKYSTMVVKKPTPVVLSEQEISSSTSNDPSDSKHVVHVNVLGVAGIVVDRKKCRDLSGDDLSPSPPEQMTAVVGISECDQESIDDITTFSSALVHAPNAKANSDDDKPQRHIAVWASNDKGETPGSIIKSKLLDLQPTNKNSSKHVPKFLDLKVALTKSSESIQHAAVVIGKARVEITEDMISGSNNRTFDLPVSQVFENSSLSSSDENRVILLRTSSKPRKDFRKLCVDEFSDMGNENNEGLASAYAIDPLGDSMIRIQVEVKEAINDPEQKTINDSSSFTTKTVATERSDESSIPSGESAKQVEGQGLYSKPLEYASQFDEDATFHTVSRKGRISAGYEAADEATDPGCKMFGRQFGLPSCNPKSNRGFASHIDDRIENMADHVFSANCAARNRDDSSLVGDGTYYTGATGTTQGKMFDEMKSAEGTMSALDELRDLAKEFALSSGEYFFPAKYKNIHERVLSEDDDVDGDDELSGMGSATLDSMEQTLSMSQDRSWRKKRDEDDNTYSTGGSDMESEDTLGTFSLNDRVPVQFGFSLNRRVMSESNKFDLGTDINQKERIGLGRSFDAYTSEAPGQLDVGNEGDDEESSSALKAALVDDIVEVDTKKNIDLKRENSGKPSLPSVVENIAEVLSIGGKACGYFSTDDVDPKGATSLVWNQRTGQVEIPATVNQSDDQSVGDLTAMTLEKNEMKETNRKLLLKRLGLPKEILSWGRTKAEMGEDESRSENPNKSGGASLKSEDYFAEYEEGAKGASSIYLSSSEELQRQGTYSVEEGTLGDNSRNGSLLSQNIPDSDSRKVRDGDQSQVESV